MPTTVMSSSILLQATTKHSALQIKFSKIMLHKFCIMMSFTAMTRLKILAS